MGEYFFMFLTAHMALSFSLRFLWVALSGIAVGATALLFITIAEGGSIWRMPETPLLSQAMTPSLRFDGLSAMLFAMISILGAAIARYARRYLDGDSRQLRFYGWLLFTLFAISIFVLSNNLAQLFLAWLMSSAGLHRLLLHFPDRPAAVLAAQKKFWISRIGDVLLLAAILWIYFLFQTLQLDELFSALQAPLTRDQESGLIGIGLLLVTGALIKSALIPFHFWLPETMEAPTPVSALMHAGIINAGGFLLIRMSPLLVRTPDALATAALAGALTAVAGAIVMSVQNDIKGKLAWSTISQMGMMILACGLGLFSVALFHIFAHSFYKAHAFMSTGELIQESKKTGFKLLPPSSNMVLVSTTNVASMQRPTLTGVRRSQAFLLPGITKAFSNHGSRKSASIALWTSSALQAFVIALESLSEPVHVRPLLPRCMSSNFTVTPSVFYTCKGSSSPYSDGRHIFDFMNGRQS